MWAGLVPSEAVRENLFHASLLASGGLLAIFGVLWLVDISLPICLHLHLAVSFCVFALVSPFYKATVILV